MPIMQTHVKYHLVVFLLSSSKLIQYILSGNIMFVINISVYDTYAYLNPQCAAILASSISADIFPVC